MNTSIAEHSSVFSFSGNPFLTHEKDVADLSCCQGRVREVLGFGLISFYILKLLEDTV